MCKFLEQRPEFPKLSNTFCDASGFPFYCSILSNFGLNSPDAISTFLFPAPSHGNKNGYRHQHMLPGGQISLL